jgi:hypothetical protein
MTLARSLKGLGLILVVTGAAIYGVSGGPDESPVAGILGALTMVAGVLVYFRGRQHSARIRSPRILEESKPDVVYLRVFRADISTTPQALMQGFTTEEEQLADVLQPFGKLVAIGRPGESLPPPGAARMYASDAQWQNIVSARITEAPLVVVRAGIGAGLLWELEHTIQNVNPKRVIIWILNLQKNEYATFCDQVKTRLGITLPRISQFSLFATILNIQNRPSKVTSGFIRFSQNWQPSFLPLPTVWTQFGYNDLRKAFSVALRPVFEEHGLQWRVLGRFD